MNRYEQDQLLQQILTGDELTALREASLARGLTLVKHQRRRRVLVRMASLASIPLLVAVVLLSSHRFAPTRRHLTAAAVNSISPPAPDRVELNGVQSITADELFALLPHHALALIGKPGHQTLICLDQPADGGNNADRTAR